MIRTKFYLDNRNRKAVEFPLCISVSKWGRTSYIPLPLRLREEQWDKKLMRIVKHPQADYLNKYINDKRYEIVEILLKLEESGLLAGLDSVQIKDVVLSKISKDVKIDKNLVKIYFEKLVQNKAASTIEHYAVTWKKIVKYEKRADTLKFEDVTLDWIKSFDASLQEEGLSINARSLHLTHLRAVFNAAIDDNVTAWYPFRKFKIKKEDTVKRNIPASAIYDIMTMPVRKHQEEARDIFMLCFYLIGINLVDLLALTTDNIIGDRLEYRRAKTGKLYSIKIEPEAKKIIEKYKGVEKLLSVGERYDNYRVYTTIINDKLKTLGDWEVNPKNKHLVTYKPRYKYLSTYYSRHSWATIAAELDIPIQTISAALGHENGAKVTLTYVAFNQRKVDEANRKVIDFVLNNGQSQNDTKPTL